MEDKTPDQMVELVAHRVGAPIWLLPFLFLLALACISLPLIIATSGWVSDASIHCPKLGCIIIEPLFNLLPNIARRVLFFLLGLFFLFAIAKNISLRIKKPVALIIDATGLHSYGAKGKERHLKWDEISTLISRSHGLALKTSAPDGNSQPIKLITTGLDVSTWDIVTAIQKYRPDLLLTFDIWKTK